MSNQDDEQAWLDTYLDTLPDNIRPTPTDRRFLNAAAAAYRNGWTGKQAANVVKTRDYRGKTNPTLVAIMELERVSDRPPAIPAKQPAAIHSVFDGRPATPAAWVVERMQLLRELTRTTGLSEDERENRMRTLIARQHAEEAQEQEPFDATF
jgi:hypothetical protein